MKAVSVFLAAALFASAAGAGEDIFAMGQGNMPMAQHNAVRGIAPQARSAPSAPAPATRPRFVETTVNPYDGSVNFTPLLPVQVVTDYGIPGIVIPEALAVDKISLRQDTSPLPVGANDRSDLLQPLIAEAPTTRPPNPGAMPLLAAERRDAAPPALRPAPADGITKSEFFNSGPSQTTLPAMSQINPPPLPLDLPPAAPSGTDAVVMRAPIASATIRIVPPGEEPAAPQAAPRRQTAPQPVVSPPAAPQPPRIIPLVPPPLPAARQSATDDQLTPPATPIESLPPPPVFPAIDEVAKNAFASAPIQNNAFFPTAPLNALPDASRIPAINEAPNLAFNPAPMPGEAALPPLPQGFLSRPDDQGVNPAPAQAIARTSQIRPDVAPAAPIPHLPVVSSLPSEVPAAPALSLAAEPVPLEEPAAPRLPTAFDAPQRIGGDNAFSSSMLPPLPISQGPGQPLIPPAAGSAPEPEPALGEANVPETWKTTISLDSPSLAVAPAEEEESAVLAGPQAPAVLPSFGWQSEAANRPEPDRHIPTAARLTLGGAGRSYGEDVYHPSEPPLPPGMYF